MFQRIVHPSGVVFWQSSLLAEIGVRHAFSTRIGGISPPPYDSLNLGNPAGCEQPDPDAHVIENFRRLQEAMGVPALPRAWVRQVHGRSVELLEPEPESDYSETLAAELRDRFSGQISADALVSTVVDVLLTIRIADCVPILFASSDGKIVAAAHAGWRGVVGNIVAKTVRTLAEAGAPASALVAAIGPCISVNHFEVGEEVAAEFANQGLAEAVLTRPSHKPHIDLRAAVHQQLTTAGVAAIDSHPLCTFADPTDFFSHRRDHGTTGRLAALIAAR